MDLRKHPTVSNALRTLQAGERLGASTPAWAASVARTLVKAETTRAALLADAELRAAKTRGKTPPRRRADEEESTVCDECGAENDADATECDSCGADLEESESDSDEFDDASQDDEDASKSDDEGDRQRRKRGNPKPQSRAVLEGERFLSALARGFRPGNEIVVEPATVGRERTLSRKEQRLLTLGMAAVHFRSGK
jgi:zinc ribbon protein